jgi:predicted ATPase/class 3 adenylate cyclase
MDEFPSGVVAFLFTDVEGSTRLLERLGDGYGAVRDRHDAVLRSAIAADGGRVVDTAGDGFFAVFPTPQRAVTAAVQAQRGLATADWPDGVEVAVRMGVHTGEGVLDGARYVGLDVHRAARIAAAAHGGQLLISDATRALVGNALPPGASLHDLGVHRLKGITQPERLYQLTVDGGSRDFPSLRTEEARPGNLPRRLTGFVGRRDQAAQLGVLVREHRLVTLTGPGGTGKTRLALHVAEELAPAFADGAFFVDLSSVGDPDLVAPAVAASLGLAEAPERPVADVVGAHLRARVLLLVMDNFEQVTAAATFLEAVLAAAPGLSVLVTSRVPLHLYGEQEFAVPPLTLPDPRQPLDPEVVGRSEAVDLFVRRASAAKAGFRLTPENAGAVAEISARLDGLPLAIELAASRAKVLSPQRMLSRLERRLPLLASTERNVPERQRTLRATIDWSHDLLAAPERCLFRRMAVFSGGADIDAVAAVADPGGELGDALDLLTTLVDDNLVTSVDEPGDELRFGMLETIREYGLDRLSASGEEQAVRRRHAEHWAELAERAAASSKGSEQAAWTRRLEADLDNIRAALAWTVQTQEPDLGLRLAVALGDHWRVASHVREGVHLVTQLLAVEAGTGEDLLRARALSVLGDLHGWIADPEGYAAAAAEALAIYRRLGDECGVAEATSMMGWAHLQLGHLEAARVDLSEAVDRYTALGQQGQAAAAMPGLAIVAQFQGDLDTAHDVLAAALVALRDVDDLFMVGLAEIMIGGIDERLGNHDAAERHLQAGLSTYLGIGNDMGASWALYVYADLALQHDEPQRALRLVGASDRMRGDTELPALMTASIGDVGQRARERLPDDVADEAYRHGQVMSVDEAVAQVRGHQPDDVAGARDRAQP